MCYSHSWIYLPNGKIKIFDYESMMVMGADLWFLGIYRKFQSTMNVNINNSKFWNFFKLISLTYIIYSVTCLAFLIELKIIKIMSTIRFLKHVIISYKSTIIRNKPLIPEFFKVGFRSLLNSYQILFFWLFTRCPASDALSFI